MLSFLRLTIDYCASIGIGQAQLMPDKEKRIGHPWHVLVTKYFLKVGDFFIRLEPTDILRHITPMNFFVC